MTGRVLRPCRGVSSECTEGTHGGLVSRNRPKSMPANPVINLGRLLPWASRTASHVLPYLPPFCQRGVQGMVNVSARLS